VLIATLALGPELLRPPELEPLPADVGLRTGADGAGAAVPVASAPPRRRIGENDRGPGERSGEDSDQGRAKGETTKRDRHSPANEETNPRPESAKPAVDRDDPGVAVAPAPVPAPAPATPPPPSAEQTSTSGGFEPSAAAGGDFGFEH